MAAANLIVRVVVTRGRVFPHFQGVVNSVSALKKKSNAKICGMPYEFIVTFSGQIAEMPMDQRLITGTKLFDVESIFFKFT